MKHNMPEIVFHINAHQISEWRSKRRLALFDRIARICEIYSMPFSAVVRQNDMTKRIALPSDGRLHIVEDGNVRGDGWLNAGTAYLLNFWHLDPNGILAESSAKTARFSPREVDKELALNNRHPIDFALDHGGFARGFLQGFV